MKIAKIKAKLTIKDLESLSRVEKNGLCVWLSNIKKDIKSKRKYSKDVKWTFYY